MTKIMIVKTWTAALKEAVQGNINGGIEPWPPGDLTQYPTHQTADGIVWMYSLNDAQIRLRIGIKEFPTMEKAEYATELCKGDLKWQDWPKGFPNQNDYDDVLMCFGNESQRMVFWVQKGAGAGAVGDRVYTVQLEGLQDGIGLLKDYADGVWGVVNQMSE